MSGPLMSAMKVTLSRKRPFQYSHPEMNSPPWKTMQ